MVKISILEFLAIITDNLLDAEVLELRCSQDKLAMRLRLLGGAVRRCDENSEAHHGICRDIWRFVHQETLAHHQDKQIRKLASKLKKDLIRGKAALYTLPCSPASQNILGNPNNISEAQVIWHIPSDDSLGFAVSILKCTVGEAIVSIMSCLENLDGGIREGEDRKLSMKQVEEKIVSLLHGVLKSVRGASELMSDEIFIGDRVSRLLTTGHALCDAFSPTTKEYLLMLRPTIIRFLLDFQIKLKNCCLKNEDYSSLSMSSDIHKVFFNLAHNFSLSWVFAVMDEDIHLYDDDSRRQQ